MNNQEDWTENYAALTADLVAAYVGNNAVRTSDLPELIGIVHQALSSLGQPEKPAAEKLVPRVPIKKTITQDYLISLEDGRHYKSLKRHLNGRGLTPASYREKWGLPLDYPMTASAYSARRSELAKSLGLGRKKAGVDAAPPAANDVSTAPKKRGRPRKAA